MSLRPRFLAGILASLALLPASPQGPGHPATRRYALEEGLPSSGIRVQAEDADGLVWVGTDAGLACFLGRQWLPFRGPLPSPLVHDILPDPQGGLWVGTRGGLARVKAFRSQALGSREGLPPGSVERVVRDPAGRIWVLASGHLFARGEDGHFQAMPLPPTLPRVTALDADAGNEVLAAAGPNLLAWRGNAWTPVPGPPLAKGEAIPGLARDGTGSLFLRATSGLWRGTGGTWERLDATPFDPYTPFFRMGRDREGWVWHASGEDLWRRRGAEASVVRLRGEDARTGFLDAGGDLWVGTDAGVVRFLGRDRFALHDAREGLPPGKTWMPARDRQGRIWVATDKGLCVGGPQGFRVVAPGRILSVTVGPDGRVWASGAPSGRIWTVDPATLKVDLLEAGPGFKGRYTSALAVDAEGRPWVGDAARGLVRGRRLGQGWAWDPVMVHGRVPERVRWVVPLPGGEVVLLHGGGASLWRRGAWSSLATGLPGEAAMAAFGPGGLLAMASWEPPAFAIHRLGQAGLTLERQVDPTRGGQVSLPIFSLGMDEGGRLWAGTDQGLALVDNAGLRLLGRDDPFLGPECNEGAILAEPGRVWVGTTLGLQSFDSRAPEPQLMARAPVILSARTSGGDLADLEAPAPLPRNQDQIQVRFTVPASRGGGAREFEARLLGVDRDWVRLDTPSVSYAGLGPGRHRLELRGLFPGGVQGPVRVLAFSVVPAWWETTPFRIAVLFLLAVAAHLALRSRTALLRRRNLQLERLVSERTRDLAAANGELQDLNAELTRSLAEVKTLKGFIPICASCKKIRSDEGFWEQIERYLSRNTAASFSHGICPDCARDLYPDVMERREKKG
ncbi:MAG TPA: two-component regulator propeller domain-containing protein [Holophaga sp.]|nr:two-component regulator propeller domain-containing protein [Holophaga sp.]